MIRKIGVIGAGQMGHGIAHVCALAGYEVKLADVNEAQLVAAIRQREPALEIPVDRAPVLHRLERHEERRGRDQGQESPELEACHHRRAVDGRAGNGR